MLKDREKHVAYKVNPKRRREYGIPKPDASPSLGPLSQLPGLWRNNAEDQTSRTFGRGWNLIALPFQEPEQFRDYRLLMNQYNEELRFSFVDDMVPNRGVDRGAPENPLDSTNTDQFLVTLDYQQTISQISAADSSNTDLAGEAGLPIHHEPGLFLHMLNERTDGIDVARLATIPHGNAVTAIGKSDVYDGPPRNIDMASSFPIGVVPEDQLDAAVDAATEDPAYLRPYNQFTVEPFGGVVDAPIFSAKTPFDTLKAALGAFDVKRTTELRMDTETDRAGIVNIPFVERQADANFMRSTFYIMELNETDCDGNHKLAIAYTQFIFLDFFPRRDGSVDADGNPQLIRWPHISINVMEKVADPEPSKEDRFMVKYKRY